MGRVSTVFEANFECWDSKQGAWIDVQIAAQSLKVGYVLCSVYQAALKYWALSMSGRRQEPGVVRNPSLVRKR